MAIKVSATLPSVSVKTPSSPNYAGIPGHNLPAPQFNSALSVPSMGPIDFSQLPKFTGGNFATAYKAVQDMLGTNKPTPLPTENSYLAAMEWLMAPNKQAKKQASVWSADAGWLKYLEGKPIHVGASSKKKGSKNFFGNIVSHVLKAMGAFGSGQATAAKYIIDRYAAGGNIGESVILGGIPGEFTGFIKGLQGKAEVDGATVIQHLADISHAVHRPDAHTNGTFDPKKVKTGEGHVSPWVKNYGGFAFDVFSDPTTYVPFGGLTKVGKVGEVGGKFINVTGVSGKSVRVGKDIVEHAKTIKATSKTDFTVGEIADKLSKPTTFKSIVSLIDHAAIESSDKIVEDTLKSFKASPEFEAKFGKMESPADMAKRHTTEMDTLVNKAKASIDVHLENMNKKLGIKSPVAQDVKEAAYKDRIPKYNSVRQLADRHATELKANNALNVERLAVEMESISHISGKEVTSVGQLKQLLTHENRAGILEEIAKYHSAKDIERLRLLGANIPGTEHIIRLAKVPAHAISQAKTVQNLQNLFNGAHGLLPEVRNLKAEGIGYDEFQQMAYQQTNNKIWKSFPNNEKERILDNILHNRTSFHTPVPGNVKNVEGSVEDFFRTTTNGITRDIIEGHLIEASELNLHLPAKFKLLPAFDKEGLPNPNFLMDSIRDFMNAENAFGNKDPGYILSVLHTAWTKAVTLRGIGDDAIDQFGFKALDDLTGGKDAVADYLTNNYGYRQLRGDGIRDSIFGGHVFHPEIARSLEKLFKVLTDPVETAEYLQAYDNFLRAFKRSVTVFSPAHHIRNFVGAFTSSFVYAGVGKGVVTVPVIAAKAARVMMNHSDMFKQLPGGGKKFIKLGKYGKQSTDAVWDLAVRSGVLSGYVASEFGRTAAKRGPLTKLIDSLSSLPVRAEEQVNNFSRMYHFVGRMLTSKASSIEQAAKIAAADVRKYLYDYTEFTKFEKQVMVRIFPFYRWSRKNIPFMLHMMFKHPGRVNAIPNLMQAIAAQQGFTSDDMESVPDWFINNMDTPLFRHKGNIVLGDISNTVPSYDVMKYLGNPKDNILSQFGPWNAPIEMLMGRSMTTQATQIDGNWLKYFTQQQGFANLLYKLYVAPNPKIRGQGDARQPDIWNKAPWWNFLMGVPALEENTLADQAIADTQHGKNKKTFGFNPPPLPGGPPNNPPTGASG